MNEKNAVTKEYMRQNDRFADVCNYCLFGGKQVVRAEDLEERDITELAVFSREGRNESREKLRDLLRHCIAKTAHGITFLMVGMENQSEIHYAMPVKNMLYDAIRYEGQVKALAAENRKKGNLKTSAEYLSGLSKSDTIMPVVTMTIYWNSGRWDAPRSLHEMFGRVDPQILEKVPDYPLNLIVPEEITDFEGFQTEFGKLMELFSCAEDTEKFETLLHREQEDGFTMSREAVQVINTCLNARIEVEEKEEDTKMCRAIDDLVARGEARGMERGKAEAEVTIYTAMYKNGFTVEQIAAAADRTVAEVKAVLESRQAVSA